MNISMTTETAGGVSPNPAYFKYGWADYRFDSF